MRFFRKLLHHLLRPAKTARYLLEARRFRTLARESGRADAAFRHHPQLDDRTRETTYDRHYVLHPAWAARVLQETGTQEHVDFSSTLHFATIVSAWVKCRFYDYRPARLEGLHLESASSDLTRLPFKDGELSSISCMHVIEHIGLGRYGDPLDPMGDHKAAKELSRVLAPGGQLLMVVPVGKPAVEFNAHRIYSHQQVQEMFSGLTLQEFALIPDDAQEGDLIRNADPKKVADQNYACGCFHFRKPR
jgi:hypothetical protein